MILTDLTVKDFVNEVDSKSPAPGGGSVSALASSMGIALTRMVGHLTVGKKKFRELDEEIKQEVNDVLETFTSYKEEMVTLIDKDTDAFNLIMAAFKLPKETEEEKAVRAQKIEEGTLEAIKVPFRVAELSLEALKELDIVLKYGNKNCLSDLGVSALMLYAGLEGAILNVKINIPGISDQDLVAQYNASVKNMMFEASEIRKDILEQIHSKL